MAEDLTFQDITLVTPRQDGSVQVLPHARVTVRGSRIEKVLPEEEAGPASGLVYDGRQRILLPALANAHTHLAMTLLRNAADDLPLHTWLFDHIFPREANLTPALVRTGSQLALVELIRNGVGAAADMYFYHEATAQVAVEAGFRLNLAVDPKRNQPDGGLKIDRAFLADELARFTRDPSDLLRVSLLVHSVYLYEPDLYPRLADLAEELACPVHVHVAETEQEVTDCLARTGRRPAAQLAHAGFFKTPTLAAHCVHLDAAERAILARHGVQAVHCPASNLKLGSGFADLRALQEAGVSVVLGTDGAASNNALDLFRDLRLAALLAKGLHRDPTVMRAREVLPLATAAGMAALGFPHSGRIEAGCAADLQVVRTDLPELTPLGDPVNALVYSTPAQAVESLMVAGRWLMKERVLLTLDEEKILFEAGLAASRLQAGF